MMRSLFHIFPPDKLNIGRVNYTRYETDKVRPDYETLIKIADFYNISLDELFGRNR
ncbi:MAG: helix-turn-helix transcriptional regulator [Clostridia bacterium]|nr:helix-turn-helix transcriptional regulator [Clostridia bacterium]